MIKIELTYEEWDLLTDFFSVGYRELIEGHESTGRYLARERNEISEKMKKSLEGHKEKFDRQVKEIAIAEELFLKLYVDEEE